MDPKYQGAGTFLEGTTGWNHAMWWAKRGCCKNSFAVVRRPKPFLQRADSA